MASHDATTEERSGQGGILLALARLAHTQSNPEAVTTHLHEAQTLCHL